MASTTSPTTERPSSRSNIQKQQRIQVVAGGASEELFKHGLPNDRNMQSASALVNLKYNDLVLDVHEIFLKAGANYILTTNHHVVPGIGFTSDEIVEYTRLAGRLAQDARQRANKEEHAKICGCLPPLMPSYRSDRTMDDQDGSATYLLIGEALWPYIDVYLAETMSSVAEAKMAYDAVKHLKKPIMISFALNRTGGLRSGEAIGQAIREVVEFCWVVGDGTHRGETSPLCAILFNCSQPEDIAKALKSIHEDEELAQDLEAKGIQLGGFGDRISPTSTAGVMEEQMVAGAMKSRLDVEIYNRFVLKWIEYGATLVGGCCGIGPDYIHSICETLREEHMAP